MNPDPAPLGETLAERDESYGSFTSNATVAQNLKAAVRKAGGWDKLAPDQKEAVDMILSKISRLSTGNPDYLDNWHDIAGYASLVETRLRSSFDSMAGEGLRSMAGNAYRSATMQSASERVNG